MAGTGQNFADNAGGNYPVLAGPQPPAAAAAAVAPAAPAAPRQQPVGPLHVREGEPKPWRLCYCCTNDFDEPNEQHIFRDYKARTKQNRLCCGCTDLFFLLAFLAFWGVVVAVLFGAKSAGGNPDLIIRGVDYQGQICGITDAVKDYKYAAWPDPLKYGFKVCLKDCAETQMDVNPDGMDYFQDSTYLSTKFLYYCLPTLNGTISVETSGDFDAPAETASRAMGDLWTAWAAILISAFVALGCSFLYSALTKRFAGLVVYTTLIFLVAGGFVTGYILLKKASDYEKSQVTMRAQALKGIGWTLVVCAAVLAVMVIALWNKIKVAVHVVKSASHAILDMPMMVLFPLLPFAFAVGYVAFWVVGALYIFGVKKETEEPVPSSLAMRAFLGGATTYTDLDWDQNYRASFAVHLFSLLWNMQFVVYFTYLVVAGAIANWYFSEFSDANRSSKRRGTGAFELPHWPVGSSLKRTLRFHLGTVALGALIIAIINVIRIGLKYVEEKIKGANPNPVQRAVFCMLQCFLTCAKYCMDKINKSAFVWVAIFGSSFGTAACSSFALIWANLARVIAITLVGEYLMLLGKIMIAFATTGIMLIVINGMYDDDELNSPVMPCVVIFILAWVVAELFMLVYETVVDTIFLCFLVDERYNDGSHVYTIEGLGRAVPEEDLKRMEQEARLRKAKFLQPYDADLYALPDDVRYRDQPNVRQKRV